MIALDRVSARGPLARAALSFGWAAGVHAVVGTGFDGASSVLALLSGALAAKSGTVTVLGGAPGGRATRQRVAHVRWPSALPEALRVREVLELAASIRGEPPAPAAARLATLGVESLAPRVVRSLAAEEVRAVALVEALTSARVEVLLVEEPLVGLDPRAAARLPERLRARAEAGACVILATASVRDAAELSDDHLLLRRGEAIGAGTTFGPLAGFEPGGARLHLLSSDPAALASALAGEVGVEGVSRREALVIARGADEGTLARAVARAVAASGVEIVEMRVRPATLEVAQGAAAGLAQAGFEAARLRALAAYASRSPGGTSS